MNETRHVIQIVAESGEIWSYPMQTKEDAECATAVLSSVKQLDISVEHITYLNNGYNVSGVLVDVGSMLGFPDEIFRAYCAHIAENETLDQTLDNAVKHIKEIPL